MEILLLGHGQNKFALSLSVNNLKMGHWKLGHYSTFYEFRHPIGSGIDNEPG